MIVINTNCTEGLKKERWNRKQQQSTFRDRNKHTQLYNKLLSASVGWHTTVMVQLSLLFSYVLATPKVISWWGPTCDSAHSWKLESVAPLEDQAASSMI